MRAVTAAAHRGARFAQRRIADRRCGARRRRLRGEIQRHAFDIEPAQLAQHRIHRRRRTPAGEVLLRCSDEIDRLLAREVRRAGGLAVAVGAVAGRAGRRHRFSVLVRREDGILFRRGGRQTGIESSDAAGLIVTQIGGNGAQGGMDALAFLVFLQRGHDVAPALSGEIGDPRSDAFAVEAVTGLAFPLRYALADANIRRRSACRDHCLGPNIRSAPPTETWRAGGVSWETPVFDLLVSLSSRDHPPKNRWRVKP